MNSIVEDILMHYGMPRRSGRYPYGSGENPYQHSGDFLSRVQELKKKRNERNRHCQEYGFDYHTASYSDEPR